MKNVLFSLLIIICTSTHAASTFTEYTIYDQTPAGHTKIAASHTWDDPIAYNYGAYVDCSGPYTDANANCYFEIDPISEGVPSSARALKLLVKSKAWALTGPGSTNRCQIFARVKSNTLVKNHFIHSETWGYGTEQRRSVNYTSIDANIVQGRIFIDVGREMRGQCITEMAIYIEGYYQ